MVHDISSVHRGKAMSVFVTGGSIGYSVGPLVITSIIAWYGLDYVPFAAIPGILIAAALFRYAPKHRAQNTSARVFFRKENLGQVKPAAPETKATRAERVVHELEKRTAEIDNIEEVTAAPAKSAREPVPGCAISRKALLKRKPKAGLDKPQAQI